VSSKGSTDPFPPVPPLCAEQLAAATLLVESIAGDENQAVFGRQPCQVPEAHGKHGKARPGWRQDFFWPSPGIFSPMPHQFPRYLQHVKPRSCHICNILEPLEGNCSILELETDGKSSILELETLISAGIGIVWS